MAQTPPAAFGHQASPSADGATAAQRLAFLRELERKVLWLSTWTIHNANHLRAPRDGLKVGGHQASSASLVTLMTALYFDVLRPQDRVAVKPHASPAYHAIQYLLGRQSRGNLERFRALGGAHQSIATPLIGMAQDGLASFEPAYADELTAIMAWSFDYMQRDGMAATREARDGWLRDAAGGAVYLRLSTRTIAQPSRELTGELRRDTVLGGYWLRAPAPGAGLAIVYSGAVAPEALAAHEQLLEDMPGAGLLAVTSADRLNAGWHAAQHARQAGNPDARAHIEQLLAPLAPGAVLVTVIDGHPATLSWLGGVYGHRVQPLGVEHFGQSGDLPDLYRTYRIDSEAILDACAAAALAALPAGKLRT